MPARTRIAVVTLLAAASAALLPVTGAAAADTGHRDRDRAGDVRNVVHHDGSGAAASGAPTSGAPASGAPVAGREAGPGEDREAGHPAAGTDRRWTAPRRHDLRVTHREHSGVSRPAAPLRPAGRVEQVKRMKQAEQAEQGKRAGRVEHVKQVKRVKQVRRHEAASNPVRRMVQAGQTVGGRRDMGKPLVFGGAALLAVGGGMCGLRLVNRRRAAREG
ncbi:hypothetical protein ACSNOK_02935 [Streptomyces sp. URMC 126]|uniref:hypothetical protein n=1 Tax=Streptomyces sp. URMC 126 TaxID=3423401 RepID=UPI003F1CDD1D